MLLAGPKRKNRSLASRTSVSVVGGPYKTMPLEPLQKKGSLSGWDVGRNKVLHVEHSRVAHAADLYEYQRDVKFPFSPFDLSQSW